MRSKSSTQTHVLIGPAKSERSPISVVMEGAFTVAAAIDWVVGSVAFAWALDTPRETAEAEESDRANLPGCPDASKAHDAMPAK